MRAVYGSGRSGASRRWLAWLASALIHALGAAILLRGWGARPLVGRQPMPIEIEITQRQEPPPPAGANTAHAPTASAAPHRASEPRRRDSAPPADRPGGAEPERDVPTAAPPDSDLPPAPTTPDLSLGALSPEVRRQLQGPPPDGVIVDQAPAPARRRPSVDEPRVELERHQDAVANVERGRVDPLVYDYLRDARARFQDEATRIAESISVGVDGMVQGWGRGYQQRLRDVHQPDPDQRDQPASGEVPGGRRPDVLGGYDESVRQTSLGAEQRRAEVCLRISPGRETAVALRRASGNRALDQLLLRSFRNAISARPLPPDARDRLACDGAGNSPFHMPPVPMLT